MTNDEEEGDYRKQMEAQLAQAQQARALELQRRQLLKQLLDAGAYERLANIRVANPELYLQLSSLLIYLYQNGQIKGKIMEEQLKEFVSRLLSKQRRETKITRVSK